VAYGDHEAGAQEQVELADLHPPLARVVARRLEDQEVEALIRLDLRALMGATRVLDRELMQIELLAQLGHRPLARLVQLQPHEAAAAARTRRRLVERERLRFAHPAHVVGALDYHRSTPFAHRICCTVYHALTGSRPCARGGAAPQESSS
jgi:hypothetical protein